MIIIMTINFEHESYIFVKAVLLSLPPIPLLASLNPYRKACEDFVRACKEGDTKAINRRLAAHINKEMVYNGLLAAHEHKRR